MSLILAAAGAMGGLWVATNHSDIARENAPAPENEGPRFVAQRPLHTGRYGSSEELAALLGHGNAYVVKTVHSTDLSGMPCRWLILSNGAAYRTYNMQYPLDVTK